MPTTKVSKTVKEALDVRRRIGERTIVFFDAVMAIAITLLVLEIDIPAIAAFGPDQLRGMFVPFTALFVSFVALGQLWYLHAQVFSVGGMAREVSVPAHLALMLLIVLFPKTTELISEYPSSPYAIAIYLACYVALVAVGFATIGCSSVRAVKRLGCWAEMRLGQRPGKESLGRLRAEDGRYDEVLDAVRRVSRSIGFDVALSVATTFGAVFALFVNPVACYVFFLVDVVGSRLIDLRAADAWEVVRVAWSRLDEGTSGDDSEGT